MSAWTGIVSKLLVSPHTETSKEKLLEKVLASAQLLPCESDVPQCAALVQWLFFGPHYAQRQTQAKLHRTFGCICLRVLLSHDREHLVLKYFTANSLARYVPGLAHLEIESPDILISLHSLWTIILPCATHLSETNFVQEHMQLLEPGFVSILQARSTLPSSVPAVDWQVALLDLVHAFPAVEVPDGLGFRSEVCVRWLALYPTVSQEGLDVSCFIRVITREWGHADEEALTSIRSVFAFLAGAPLLTLANHEYAAVADVWRIDPSQPSPALSLLVARFPGHLVGGVGDFILQAARQVADSLLLLAMNRMLQWPLTEKVSPWVITVMEGLTKAAKFELLATISRTKCSLVIMQVRSRAYQHGAVMVLRRLLLGYQHKEDAFHQSLPDLRELLGYFCELLQSFAITTAQEHSDEIVVASDSCTPASAQGDAKSSATCKRMKLHDGHASVAAAPREEKHHQSPAEVRDPSTLGSTLSVVASVVQMMNALMYLFTGYPELYAPVIGQLKTLRTLSVALGETYAMSEGGGGTNTTTMLAAAHSPTEFQTHQLLQSNRWCGTSADDWERFVGSGPSHKSATGRVGLLNKGNTCFMNSALQGLFLTDSFYKHVVSSVVPPRASHSGERTRAPDNTTCTLVKELQRLFVFLAHTSRPFYDPSRFLKSLPVWFQDTGQHDASEVSKAVVDAVCTVLDANATPPSSRDAHGVVPACDHCSWKHPDTSLLDHKSHTTVDTSFGGLIKSVIQCSVCHSTSVRVEPFSDVALPFLGASTTTTPTALNEMLQRFLQPELLDGSNLYMCSPCGVKCEASKSLVLVRAPEHLMINLKRHSYDSTTQRRSKILTPVNFPFLFELPLGNEVHSTKDAKSASASDDEHTEYYILYAAVIHSGTSAQSGHYYTIGVDSNAAARAFYKRLAVELVPPDPHSGKESTATVAEVPRLDKETLNELAERCAREDLQWLNYNDSVVSRSSYTTLRTLNETFRSDVPYVLLYRRVCPYACSHRDFLADKQVALQRRLEGEVEVDNARFAVSLTTRVQSASRTQVNSRYAAFRKDYYGRD